MIERLQIMSGDFAESIKAMPNESVGLLFKALWAYAMDEDFEEIVRSDPRVETLFPVIKNHIDRNEEYRKTKAESGRRGGKAGGAPIGNTNASKSNQIKANQSKSKQNKPPCPCPCPSPNPINKKTYGVRENVLLTDEEHQKVIEAGLTDLIDELSLYIDSKGAKYKSHYSTILAWARRREKESKPKNKEYQFQQMPKRTDYDIEALEKKLIKNL